MGNIRVLSDEIASKIAAGEIIERPASALKEIIENSLDARSTEIQVEIKRGGKKLISVTDNGEGMTRDNALLSLERHATSKISDIDDIFSIKTLGFRGEALPSIAGVSRFRLTTKAKGEIVGTRISVDGGTIRKVEEIGCPEGTKVEVRDLFYSTPPRLKFMKTDETELTHILDIIQREAIAYPEVGFEVLSEGKTHLCLPRRQCVRERALELFPDIELFEVRSGTENIEIYGFMGSPEDKRTTTQRLYVYVNRRPVRDRFVTRILIDSYGRLIEKGRFPQGIIFIQIPHEEVDINVHPTKNEVRFRRTGLIADLIKAAVQEMLRNAPWIKDYKSRVENAVQEFYERRVGFETPELENKRRVSFVTAENNTTLTSELGAQKAEGTSLPTQPPIEIRSGSDGASSHNLFKQNGFFSALGIIGQVGELYIVCESERGMILIDQHAAHERIMYEKLKKAYLKREIETQELLLPILVQLSPSELQTIGEYKEEIESLGIKVEDFGGGAFLIRSFPAFLKNADAEKLIKDVIGEIAALDKQESLSEHVDHIIATMACHSSVRAKQGLSREKIKALLEELDRAEFPHCCPHGRPVATGLTFEELEKMFKRA
ncbi:MAG TPA: DNA mismatch repair endonuclease MutL [Thermodesulfobacteriota bacterium]|nr:DNA mismatch repair endonuclease MutL [Thermodesulfobacteriota bacterium]